VIEVLRLKREHHGALKGKFIKGQMMFNIVLHFSFPSILNASECCSRW